MQSTSPKLISTATEHMDIVVERPKQSPLFMLGSGGREREENIIAPWLSLHSDGSQKATKLPVFVGAGFGYGILALLKVYQGPLVIIDKETDIQKLTQIKKTLQEQCSTEQLQNIFWIENENTDEVLRLLTHWQTQHGGQAFIPLVHSFYLRYEKEWYSFLRDQVKASQNYDFWTKVRKPRFVQNNPRVLLITSKYFLMGELAHACKKLNLEHKLLTIPDESIASSDFIKTFLTAVAEFEPDCLITMNHLGIDKEGILMGLLEQLQLPLASWFVDNPHLIVHEYQNLKSPWVHIFTWDMDNIDSLQRMGFEHVSYLPLGTNTDLFCPNTKGKSTWKRDISFVGNSMLYKVQTRLAKTILPVKLLESFEETALNFCHCHERSVVDFLKNHAPHTHEQYLALTSNEVRLGYETALTWEATRVYRASCVEQILPFNPLLVGDDGWNFIFAKQKGQFGLHRELNYYSELSSFYPLSDINFNCTSKQMKGAVNQRIFDVPACNAFVLTDWREQMDALFEPQKEIISYKELEEIPDLVRYYLAHPEERKRITQAARQRVLAEHTWEHRLQDLLRSMQQVYGQR